MSCCCWSGGGDESRGDDAPAGVTFFNAGEPPAEVDLEAMVATAAGRKAKMGGDLDEYLSACPVGSWPVGTRAPGSGPGGLCAMRNLGPSPGGL